MGAPFEPPFGWDEADPHPGLQCHDAHPERAHKIPAAPPRDYDPMHVRTTAAPRLEIDGEELVNPAFEVRTSPAKLAEDLAAANSQTLEEAGAAFASAARVDRDAWRATAAWPPPPPRSFTSSARMLRYRATRRFGWPLAAWLLRVVNLNPAPACSLCGVPITGVGVYGGENAPELCRWCSPPERRFSFTEPVLDDASWPTP
jgi:hypothetical protein